MQASPACSGDHTGFEMPREMGDRFGRPDDEVDVATMAGLVGAAQDGCQPCQQRLLDVVQSDPLTTTRLAELAAVAMQSVAGGIPRQMTTENGPSTHSAPFRTLVRTGLSKLALPPGVVPNHRPMYEAAAAMTDAERREAVDDAVDTLIGVMNPGSVTVIT